MYDQFVLGQDFNVSYGIMDYGLDFHSIQELLEGHNEIKIDKAMKNESPPYVDLEKIITTWGNCYKISSNFLPYSSVTSTWTYVKVNFIEDNFKDSEIPEIDFYVTSNDNAYGLTLWKWFDGQQRIFAKSLKVQKSVLLRPERSVLPTFDILPQKYLTIKESTFLTKMILRKIDTV